MKFSADFAEAGLQTRLASRAADAGLGIADNAGSAVDHTGLQEGTKREIGGRGIAARVRNQPRGGDPLTAELGQPVDRLGQQFRLGVGFLIPGGVVLRGSQAERAAQIHHTRAGRQHERRQLHGDFRRSRQEYNGKLLLAYRVGRTRDARRRLGAANGRCPAVVFPVVHEDRFDMCVSAQYADQLRPAVASIADDSCPFHV